MVDDRRGGSFDERAALDDLERFRQKIERERARRRGVSDEFETFVRAFKTPGGPAAAAHGASAAAPVGDAPAPTPPPRPAAPFAASEPAAVRVGDLLAALESQPTPARARRRLAPVVVALLIVGTALTWMFWPVAPASPPAAVTEAPPAAATSPATAPATEAPAQAAAPPVPPEPAPAVTELTTSRTVWLRIIVDGERVLERELPAGSRIPLTPKETIVIRTGDAGAVQLTIAGKDQGPLGREGQVVTRTFTVGG